MRLMIIDQLGGLWSDFLLYLRSSVSFSDSTLSGKPPTAYFWLPINVAMLTCSEQHPAMTG
jgi:hypothetical protein